MGEGAGEAATGARFGPWRRELRAFLELFALTGVAVTQPALDLLSKNAGLFITLRTSAIATVALVLIIVFVPAAVLWAVESLIGAALPRVRPYVHALFAVGIVTVIAIEVLKKQTALPTYQLLAVAAPIGLIAGLLVFRVEVARMFLRYLAFAPFIFAVLFLFSSPVTSVVFDSGTAPAKNLHIGKPKRVVMIVMDEFPLESLLDGTGHVDASLFPNFAQLASGSTWFRNDTTVAPYTHEAVPAILTGDYPEGDYTPPVAAEYPHNLFTLLGGSYRMNVHESITRLCPTGTCTQAGISSANGNRFTQLLHTTYSLWEEFASPKRTATTLNVGSDELDPHPLATGAEFVKSLQPGNGRELDFLHVLLPHQPWHLRVTGQDDGQPSPPKGMYLGLAWNNPWAALSGRQRHLLQLQAADRLLGDVIAKLKRIGAYDQSLIVVTADHGVAFSSQSSIRGVSKTNSSQILWTPMFFRLPGQTAGVVDDHAVKSIDILPTIADVLDTRLPWKVDGESMLRPDTRASTDARLFHWNLNELKPPPGSEYLTFPDAPGFAETLAGRASDATGPPDLRLYKIGPYGDLVGRPAAPLVSTTTPTVTGTLEHPSEFDDVHPTAASIPWTFVQGTLNTPKTGVPLVVAVNGVIAGVAESEQTNAFAATAEFWSTLPPQMFRRGGNQVVVYQVTGTPGAPHLVEVAAS
jgi:Sulfatase